MNDPFVIVVRLVFLAIAVGGVIWILWPSSGARRLVKRASGSVCSWLLVPPCSCS